MERFLNVTETRRRFLDLIDELEASDRIVITKRGQPRAVLVNAEHFALLEDLAWTLSDPARRRALEAGWRDLERGDVVELPSGQAPTLASILDAARLARGESDA